MLAESNGLHTPSKLQAVRMSLRSAHGITLRKDCACRVTGGPEAGAQRSVPAVTSFDTVVEPDQRRDVLTAEVSRFRAAIKTKDVEAERNAAAPTPLSDEETAASMSFSMSEISPSLGVVTPAAMRRPKICSGAESANPPVSASGSRRMSRPLARASKVLRRLPSGWSRR